MKPFTRVRACMFVSWKSLKQTSVLQMSHKRQLLERFFKSNWSESQVSLYSDATIVASCGDKCHETVIEMSKQAALVIFGKQLKDVPKIPSLPTGFRVEQLLAIGLFQNLAAKASNANRERMSITFHWFLPLSFHELCQWITAINSSIPNNKQILTNDQLTLSLMMAEALHYNNMMLNQASYLTSGSGW